MTVSSTEGTCRGTRHVVWSVVVHLMAKYADLIRNLKQGRLLPLYLFSGEETFLIQQVLELIVAQAVAPGARDFNLNTLYAKETPAGEVVALCQTLPCMSPRRLVIVKEFESYKAADLEPLTAYCAAPSETTCLVLIANERKYDKKAVAAAVESGGGEVVVYYPLHEGDVAAWISDWARARGLTIRPDAAEYVKQTLGTDLQKINNELVKVEISLRDRKTITLEDVRQVVGDFRDYSAFDLVEAVGKKDRERAFLILGRILQEGEQPVGLLGMMAWNFRRLMKARGMEGAGCGYDEIKRKLNVLYFQSASFQQQMRRFSQAELRRSFRVMLAADRALKSSGLSGGLVLERMILELCGT